MKYKCIKQFAVEQVDENGFELQDEGYVVEKDSVWVIFNKKDNENVITLVSIKDSTWLEIDTETLEEHFKEIEK